MRLILASSSPRRKELLRSLGWKFLVRAPHIDETALPGETARKYVLRMAKEKAQAVFEQQSAGQNCAILAADTIVVHQRRILGKPKDKKEAFEMLCLLSGKTHEVLTAFSWIFSFSRHQFMQETRCIATRVRFADKPDSFWKWYVSTGEPMDKAGAYAAQGRGHGFIESVQGSYSNVIGLPLTQVVQVFESSLASLKRKKNAG